MVGDERMYFELESLDLLLRWKKGECLKKQCMCVYTD